MKGKKKVCEPFDKLKGLMREKKYSQEKLSGELNISIISLNRKLNGKAVFQWPEMDKLLKILEIPDAEIKDYFFPPMLRKRNKSA